jgi:hypothetical protein
MMEAVNTSETSVSCGATTQKTVTFILVAVRIWNLTLITLSTARHWTPSRVGWIHFNLTPHSFDIHFNNIPPSMPKSPNFSFSFQVFQLKHYAFCISPVCDTCPTHSRDLDIDERIILKWISMKYAVTAWTGSNCLRIGSSEQDNKPSANFWSHWATIRFSRTLLHEITCNRGQRDTKQLNNRVRLCRFRNWKTTAG